jgi:uncharacterized membrane protein YeaQ/YmgE (transglycosylase-associated protein family)
MEFSGFLGAVIVGAVIGALGRLVLPGKQKIGIILTIIVGVVAALVGTFIASAVGVEDTAGIDWLQLAFQVGLAAVGVGVLSAFKR